MPLPDLGPEFAQAAAAFAANADDAKRLRDRARALASEHPVGVALDPYRFRRGTALLARDPELVDAVLCRPVGQRRAVMRSLGVVPDVTEDEINVLSFVADLLDQRAAS